jgi:capsular polysaccharide biosynthesis protein
MPLMLLEHKWMEYNMLKLIIGFILGLVVSTVGFNGIAEVLDKGVNTIKSTSESLVE